MTSKKKILAGALVLASAALLLTACESDAHTVSDNLSKEAEQFRIPRDIVFYNGITDKYIAEVKGYCSVDSQDGLPGGTLAVTCKETGGYSKDYLGKSDNVTWFMLQTEASAVSAVHREIILKPLSVLPEFTGSDNG